MVLSMVVHGLLFIAGEGERRGAPISGRVQHVENWHLYGRGAPEEWAGCALAEIRLALCFFLSSNLL
ncbi:hypothetical protein L2E82_25265 [Cichorium intybus]|uniref:Uncharacterized protein n=1 Tax=Cichorium intybus TaxID=13427 RepID=A0ACB9E2I7_CICIN|nr:hypothetical protein L2E82_25265 [Cichorium intybus]